MVWISWRFAQLHDSKAMCDTHHKDKGIHLLGASCSPMRIQKSCREDAIKISTEWKTKWWIIFGDIGPIAFSGLLSQWVISAYKSWIEKRSQLRNATTLTSLSQSSSTRKHWIYGKKGTGVLVCWFCDSDDGFCYCCHHLLLGKIMF